MKLEVTQAFIRDALVNAFNVVCDDSEYIGYEDLLDEYIEYVLSVGTKNKTASDIIEDYLSKEAVSRWDFDLASNGEWEEYCQEYALVFNKHWALLTGSN